MKAVLYKINDVQEIVGELNRLEVSGVQNARIISKLGDILEGGKIIELPDNEEKEGDETGDIK